ncbi:hypothetical protein [Halalkalibacter okhensis]|uniref:Uncharacterized protein n=1 Tax=Halalkalibacter okhensis TaxID=333138 RepID=A0A0B0IGJ2_9BACI|nr:hypothetical protein [Halalkalibacter okhensis]KHF39992.1 hypothetical protein LQ50_11925 [Halalkalibacter okhensis]
MEQKAVKVVQVDKLMYVIGIFIFGGLLLASFLDATFYIEEYSWEHLITFRVVIAATSAIYYLLVYFYHRHKG